MRHFGFLAFAAMALCASQADAAFLDGNELYRMCQSNYMQASMFAVGVYDSSETSAEAYQKNPPICLPRNATIQQVADITCGFLKDNPATRQYTAASEVLSALIGAFPCK